MTDELDLTAGEYVLGTLSGEERARVEADAASDGALAAAIERWQRRLAPLISAGPVEVPVRVWARIEAKL